MTFLRHAPRHIHQSVIDYVTAQLTTLGWFTEGDVPFGLPPLTIVEARPFVGGMLDNRIVAGCVAITLGTELPPSMEELGGPLASQAYPIFCDVFMEGESAALAVATDIRDAFLGRHATSKTSIAVTNQVTDTAEAGWKIYFSDVERVAPEHTFPLSWNSVHVTAETYFQEVLY